MPLTLAHTVHTYSTGTLGRAICNARTHHLCRTMLAGMRLAPVNSSCSGVSAWLR